MTSPAAPNARPAAPGTVHVVAHYPEQDALVAQARARWGSLVDPRALRDLEAVAARRGRDWCTAVLGEEYRGLRARYALTPFILLLADEAGLNPPLPDHLLVARAEHAARVASEQQALQDRSALARARQEAAWDDARTGLPVTVTVRENRRSPSKPNGTPQRHAVPDDDVHGPRRLHPAGRSLCEGPDRAIAHDLGDPVDQPATCHRCLQACRSISGARR